MATWKKVIVSGSNANLTTLQVDNLTSGQVVIGGGTGNLSTTAINGTGNIVATTGASGLTASGSFSGSFFGDGSGLNNVSAAFPATQKTNLINTDKFFINDGTSKYIIYSDLLTDLAGTNLTVEGNDSLTLASQIAVTGVTASFTGSLTGALTGTASFASNAGNAYQLNGQAASYYLNASNINAGTLGNAYLPSAINVTSVTASFNGNLAGTASWATNAVSVSSIANNVTNNTDNYILTATGAGTINGESNLQFNGTTLTVTGNATITNNLIVQGTASFQNTQNLQVADRFVLLASGSNATGDGGLVVQQATQDVGELFGYENSINRWGFTSSFTANGSTFTAAAYVTSTEVGTAVPTNAPLYGGASNGFGNIYVKTDTGDIYIYA